MISSIPKLLITLGVVLIIVGLIWQVGGRFINLGKLPGDILFTRGNTTVYFPIVTSIVISIVLSLLFYFIGRMR